MAAFHQRVFSGMQPTATLHLGNYLGALTNWVAMQKTHDCIYCVVDMHAITQGIDVWGGPAELTRATREVTAAYIAAGVDPKQSIIFNQSQVPQHAELAWVFNTVARLGWLNRMTQFKEKAGKDRENASIGLYSLSGADGGRHPALQGHPCAGRRGPEAASRARPRHRAEVQQRFRRPDRGQGPRHRRSRLLPAQPEPLIQGPAPRVMSLRDGTKKMSKSDPSDYSRINLTDDAETIAQKVRKAKTDPEALPSEEKGLEGRPEAENLVGIYAGLSGATKAEVLGQFGGGQFSGFKAALVDLAVAKLAPIAGEMRRLLGDVSHIDAILGDGADRAEAIAAPIMREVKDIVGFVRRG